MPAKPLALRYRRRLWQTLRTVEKVAAKADPFARWDQSTYGRKDECGTACCFAGWAAMKLHKPMDDHHRMFVQSDGTPLNVGDWAQQYFGLNDRERLVLFHANNSLPKLRRLVREFAGPEPKAGRR